MSTLSNYHMKKRLPEGKPLPPVYRHVIKTDWFRQFTFKERIMILLGFNLIVLIRIPTQHSPGSHQPIIAGQLSKHPNPDEHLRDRMENLLVDQKERATD